MSIRTRMIIILLVASLLPWVITVFLGSDGINQVGKSISEQGIQAAQESQQAIVKREAKFTADQISLYLELNPSLNLQNSAALMKDPELFKIMSRSFGQTGSLSLYDSQLNILFHSQKELVGTSAKDLENALPDFWFILWQGFSGRSDSNYARWKDSNGNAYNIFFAVSPVGSTPLVVGASVHDDEINSGTDSLKTRMNNTMAALRGRYILLFLVIGFITAGASVFVGHEIVGPIRWMAATATQALRVVQGMFKSIPPAPRNDELSVLSHVVGIMEQRLRDEFFNLEKQIKARTGELQQRTAQLETAAQVARESADILDVRRLLDRATRMISDRFGFYHAGVFLIDEANEYAILRASNSDGGQRMLARGHKLKVGSTGIVGHVVGSGEARVTLDVTADRDYYNNPDLPHTKSEAALPLKAHERVIGVLDVQSTQANAFTKEDVRVLQILADQIALAIENARLYEASQTALQELKTLYGEQARQAWAQRLAEHPLAYMFSPLGVEKATREDLAKNQERSSTSKSDDHTLTVPIMMRNQVLGSVILRRDADKEAWTSVERDLAGEAVIQLSQALENARLMEEIARRAQQERLISQISARIQRSLDLDTVIKTAVQEVGSAVGASKVQIVLRGREPVPFVSGNGGSEK